MENKFFAAAFITGAIISASSAFAEDGTVNFTGEITDEACIVDIGTNNTMTVELGKVARTAFEGSGSKSSATKFVLKVKDCPETVNGATVKFDGVGYEGDDSVLQLTQDTDVAKGVAIELSDQTQTKLPLFTASAPYTLTAGDNELPFYARYIAMSDEVTAGPANSVTQFTLNYN